MKKNVKNIFKKYDGVMRTSQLNENGIYYRNLKQLIDNGEVEQIRRGYYQYMDENSFSDIPLIAKLFPDSIICMESALDYYGYTERTPSAWHIAVDNKSARTRFEIDYPLIKPHFIATDRLLAGAVKVKIDGVEISIYDRDRTICDCLLHRKKIDAEVFNFAIQHYLRDDKKDRVRLAEYAKLLRVEKKVREVLAIWL
ncbi:MAG: type IV toxin-antitoxin system AbiEi family antitoxin domain-containing protein [Hespellia sp.]|nr:type IV toxin-antitoxin system AbiEi family antitoxin domain-containing protein [Hespellia sp.]